MFFSKKIVMWPSGEVWVCKTLNGGSNPPMTSIATSKLHTVLDFG